MKTISAAVERVEPNTTIWVRKGVYPESVEIHRGGVGIQSPITISGWPGEEDQVILTGADRVTGWEPYGENLWRRKNWEAQWEDWGAGHPGWESGEPPFDPVKRWRRSWREHLFLEGQELMHMESFAALIPMSFTVDKEQSICYLKLANGLNPNEKNLEASRRSTDIKVNSDSVVVRGLVVERFTESGLVSHGQRCRFENIVTRYNYDGVGMSGSNNIYRGIRAIYNGRTGMTGGPTDCIVTDSLLLYNNTKGITQSFHAGGMKICDARNVTIRRVKAFYNRGVGIWFDIYNKHITVENCTAVGNANTGIFIEISDGPCLVRNNFCMNNSTGIVIAESDDCTVVHNTCLYNQKGFAMRYGDRPRMYQSGYLNGKRIEHASIDRKEPQGAFTVRNLTLSNNIFAYNTQVQLDGRHWQKDTWRDAVKNNYQSDYNLLWAGSSDAALIGWETGMIQRLGNWPLRDRWETHSIVAEPGFEGRGPYDFALSPDSPASKTGNTMSACPDDRYGRRWMMPAAGAVEPVLHEVWSSRTLDGQGETNAWPDPD
ncbi:right-handed parallel beta-helix repeat-containing protein [Candidatus Poribacteria bacterium]